MRTTLCICAVLMVLPLYVYSAPPVMAIQNNRLMIDGVEFIVKGVNYAPSPIGQKSMTSDGYGGAGFCSPKITPWFEWKSACYDSDYFDGSPDPYTPSRFPTGFKPLWERDFVKIKAIGANTVRLFNANPSTLAATKQYTNLFTVASGKDHTQFVKYCEDNGLKIIFPLFSDEPSFLNLDEDVFRRYVRWQIDEVGNSPAILMWQLGNEQTWSWEGRSNVWNDPNYTAKLNRMLTFIRTYTQAKWKRFIPVTSTIPNTFKSYNYMFQNWAVDIFTANIYGTNYDSLYGGNQDQLGIAKLSCYYNKPLMMTEVGPTAARGQVYNTGALNTIWYQFVKNVPNGCVGAVWFEQTDEPALGKDFGLFGLAVATAANGAKSDQQDVFTPDLLVQKQQYLDAYSGTYNNQQYNMRSSVFSLMGRNPYTTTNNPDTCASKYTLKSCPGTTLPKCSGNGVCDRTSGTCICQPGWSGSSCSVASCSCNSRGVCNTQTYPVQCACNAGYWGSSCQYAVQANVCPKLNNLNCTNGNGICGSNGACVCHPGWTGVDCRVSDVGIGSINIQHYFYACLSSSATFAVTAPATSSLTNQECRYYCASRGYTYAATSGGSTCQCGNSLTSTTTSTSCVSLCSGDSQQRCGGTSSQKSVYFAGSLSSTGYIGCFMDNGTRDLPVSMPSGAGTVDTCRKACAAQAYTYAGSQAGGECWCGNAYGNTGGAAAESDCAQACSGDNSVKCGAGWRNSIYTANIPVGFQLYG